MIAASQPQLVTLRSGDVVRIRPVRPDDKPALVRAYANLGEQSRYRRFFTVMPRLPEATLKAAVEVDHADHEALIAVPLLSAEIIGECRFIRLPDHPGTAEIGVTVVDAWQGRGLGFALLARLSERATAAGIEYFAAEVLAENRTMLRLLPAVGQVQTEWHGPLVRARVKLAEPPPGALRNAQRHDRRRDAPQDVPLGEASSDSVGDLEVPGLRHGAGWNVAAKTCK